MRVIAGSARSVPLIAPQGLDTRPTTDKIKETLFNMINFDLPDCVFIDLYSGSGAIGIEAISRGARHAYFVEKNKKGCEIIVKNLAKTKLTEHATVIKKDVLSALSVMGSAYDIIFLDPPYALGSEADVLSKIKENHLLKEDGFVIIEADLHRDFSFVNEIGFEITRQKTYKTNQHVFLREL